MTLGIPVYDGVNLLDVAGPYEMFNWVGQEEGIENRHPSVNGDSGKTMNGIRFEAHGSFCPSPTLDVLWAPGGDPDVLAKYVRSQFGVPRLFAPGGAGCERGVLGLRGRVAPGACRFARRTQRQSPIGRSRIV